MKWILIIFLWQSIAGTLIPVGVSSIVFRSQNACFNAIVSIDRHTKAIGLAPERAEISMTCIKDHYLR